MAEVRREEKGLQMTPPNTDYCAGLLSPGHLGPSRHFS